MRDQFGFGGVLSRFIYIRRLESSTRFDLERYLNYAEDLKSRLQGGVRSLLEKKRYVPGEAGSFWRSQLLRATYAGRDIQLTFESRCSAFQFSFIYGGVKRVDFSEARVRAPQSLTVQELILLRSGVFRHAFADLAGNTWTVYATNLDFLEDRVH